MNSKAETQGARGDAAKIVLAAVLAAAGVAAFYALADQILVIRLIPLLVAVGLAAFVMARTVPGGRAIGYIGEARTEVRKVVWPSRAETVQTSLAVFAMVLALGVFLWLADMVVLWVVRTITGQGG